MKRKLMHHLFRAATGLCALAVCGISLVVIGAIVQRGWPALRWSFFTDQIQMAGASGGIVYNLIGTGILIATAFAASAPVALAVALMHEVYLPPGRWRRGLELLLYLLNGVPSILFGLFGFMVFVQWLGWGKSWFSGGLLLGFMILPTVTVALMGRLAAIPRARLEAAAALGLRRPQIIRAVLLPPSLGGLFTGALLGLARAAGETAPIMFTATVFTGATLPDGIRESPVLSLPYHIFILAQDSFDPATGVRLWGTALTLLLVVSALSLLALPARLRHHSPASHD
jgi:phosphate transport system permease protein